MGDLGLMHSARQSTLYKSPCKETSQCVCPSPQDPAASSCTDSKQHPNTQSRAGVPAAVSQQGHRATPATPGQHSPTVGWVSPPGSGQHNAWHFQHHPGGKVWKVLCWQPGESQGAAAGATGEGAGTHRPSHRTLLLPCSNRGCSNLKPKAESQKNPNTGSSLFEFTQNQQHRHQNQPYPHQDVSAQHSCYLQGLFLPVFFSQLKQKLSLDSNPGFKS